MLCLIGDDTIDISVSVSDLEEDPLLSPVDVTLKAPRQLLFLLTPVLLTPLHVVILALTTTSDTLHLTLATRLLKCTKM